MCVCAWWHFVVVRCESGNIWSHFMNEYYKEKKRYEKWWGGRRWKILWEKGKKIFFFLFNLLFNNEAWWNFFSLDGFLPQTLIRTCSRKKFFKARVVIFLLNVIILLIFFPTSNTPFLLSSFLWVIFCPHIQKRKNCGHVAFIIFILMLLNYV